MPFKARPFNAISLKPICKYIEFKLYKSLCSFTPLLGPPTLLKCHDLLILWSENAPQSHFLTLFLPPTPPKGGLISGTNGGHGG